MNGSVLKAILAAVHRSQAVIEFELDGTIITANSNFLDAMGYTLDEVKGKHHRMFVSPEYADSEEYKAFWESLRKGHFQAAEYKRFAKGGKEIWIQATYNPVLNGSGKPIRVIKFATDVTAQKLRNADYQGQIEAIHKSQAVIEFNLDGTILKANENFCRALGYREHEIVGKHHRMFVDTAYANSDDYHRFWETLSRGQFLSGEFKRVDKSGNEVWIQASYNPIFDPDGRPFKVVKFASDITEQVHARMEAERVAESIERNLDNIVESVNAASMQSASASSASDQTSSMVQAVASATEELEATTREIAHSMTMSQTDAERAMSETEATDSSTQDLAKVAESMTNIVKIIQDIANQINLLALNATIESARAGEAGKGFAVVASEVKTLANQVASATEQISEEISGVQTVSGKVVERLSAIKRAVESVQTSVTSSASAIEEQNMAMKEIATNMQTAAQAVSDTGDGLNGANDAIGRANEFANEVLRLHHESKAAQAA